MNNTVPYPRICAHRGLSALYPENSLASFQAAIEAGAQEIEFDLRPAKDGRIIVRHDPIRWRVPKNHLVFEDVLRNYGRRVIMNIHVKQAEIMQGIVEAIDRHACQDYVYLTGNAAVMEAALALAPGIERCCLEGNKDYKIVKHALKYAASKVQFRAQFFTPEMIDEAHANGIRCNVFYTDDPARAREFFEMGIDTVLTNNCLRVSAAQGSPLGELPRSG